MISPESIPPWNPTTRCRYCQSQLKFQRDDSHIDPQEGDDEAFHLRLFYVCTDCGFIVAEEAMILYTKGQKPWPVSGQE